MIHPSMRRMNALTRTLLHAGYRSSLKARLWQPLTPERETASAELQIGGHAGNR